MLYSDLPKNSKKRFLVITVDGLQDTARQTFGALRGLPHNRLEAILYEASKTGIGKIQDWLVKNSGWAEDAMQYFLMLFVCNGARGERRELRAARTTLR